MDSSSARVDKQVYITYLGIHLADVVNFYLIFLRAIHVRVARRIVHREVSDWSMASDENALPMYPTSSPSFVPSHIPKTPVVEGMTAVAIKSLTRGSDGKRKMQMWYLNCQRRVLNTGFDLS